MNLLPIHPIPKVVMSRKVPGKNAQLPDDFKPGPYDVICGRGRLHYDHIGNRRFRLTIEMFIPRYLRASTKSQKSLIVMEIVAIVRDSSPNGGFVKKLKDGSWAEIGDIMAREKTGHAIRESIHAGCDSKTGRSKVFEELFCPRASLASRRAVRHQRTLSPRTMASPLRRRNIICGDQEWRHHDTKDDCFEPLPHEFVLAPTVHMPNDMVETVWQHPSGLDVDRSRISVAV